MKKLFFILFTCLILAGLCACDHRAGWPKRVKFPRSGGTKEISGECSIYQFGISNYDGYGPSSTLIEGTDTLTATYEWLTVKARQGDNMMTLIANPEKRNKQHLYIDFMDMNLRVDICVTME